MSVCVGVFVCIGVCLQTRTSCPSPPFSQTGERKRERGQLPERQTDSKPSSLSCHSSDRNALLVLRLTDSCPPNFIKLKRDETRTGLIVRRISEGRPLEQDLRGSPTGAGPPRLPHWSRTSEARLLEQDLRGSPTGVGPPRLAHWSRTSEASPTGAEYERYGPSYVSV